VQKGYSKASNQKSPNMNPSKANKVKKNSNQDFKNTRMQ